MMAVDEEGREHVAVRSESGAPTRITDAFKKCGQSQFSAGKINGGAPKRSRAVSPSGSVTNNKEMRCSRWILRGPSQEQEDAPCHAIKVLLFW